VFYLPQAFFVLKYARGADIPSNSDLGRSLVDEMNRLGVLVDLSHTSDDTAKQAIQYSKAPVIWSHSSARTVHAVPRNVPDDILELIGHGEGQTDAVVMVCNATRRSLIPHHGFVRSTSRHTSLPPLEVRISSLLPTMSTT